jgi:hypothetical protein
MDQGRNQADGNSRPASALTAEGSATTKRAHGSTAQMTRLLRHPLAQLASVLVALGVITAHVQFKPAGTPSAKVSASRVSAVIPAEKPVTGRPESSEPSGQDEPGAAADVSLPASAPDVTAAAATVPVAPPKLDRAAIALAEAGLDATSRDRARAEDRAAAATRELAQATAQAALETARARKLAFLVRDPSIRIAQAANRGGFLRGQREQLAKEVSTLRQLPGPKLKTILGKSPVSRPATSDEFHFELRHDRVSFINIERLMELTKADAQVRMRMADRVPVISSQVGPVGSFSLAYELVRAMPNSVEELLERRSIRFDLRAWEVIAESENHGETYESTRNPISEFSRATNRMSPSHSTVTFWVYPDSFGLYRRLREDLVARGFSVAGRPLPEGMTIRGSPMGTQSAAQ